MFVKNCYFENNYARMEPGCINNCALLTVSNTTFYKNRAHVWAGAIHTHGGAVGHSAIIYSGRTGTGNSRPGDTGLRIETFVIRKEQKIISRS